MLSPTFSSVLAIVVALASLFLFLISFVAPRLYRAQDLWWSGVGMFYALVLWFCSAQIRGAVLLGTIASVSLLGWLSTQVYLNRWAALTDAEKAGGVLKQLQGLGQRFSRLLESRPPQAQNQSPSTTDAAIDAATDAKATPEATAKTTAKIMSPEVPSAKAEKGPKVGKVRWVRPEKPKPSESASEPVTPEGGSSPIDSSRDQEPIVPESTITAPTIADPTISEPSITESSPSESTIAPETEVAKAVDEWNDMEADLEAETPAQTSKPKSAVSKASASAKPESPKAESPKPETVPAETAKMGVIKRIQNFFQRRKSHGKRFVRPDEEAPTPPPASKSRLEPSVSSRVETSPPELSELPIPVVETIETLADLKLESDASESSITPESPSAETPVTETSIVESPVAENPIVESPVTKTSIVESPSVETPVTETPIVENPVAENSIGESPVAENSIVESPSAGSADPSGNLVSEDLAPEASETIDNGNPSSGDAVASVETTTSSDSDPTSL